MKIVKLEKNSQKSVFIDILKYENPHVSENAINSDTIEEFYSFLRDLAGSHLDKNKLAKDYYERIEKGRKIFEQLKYKDYSAIRIMDYLDRTGDEYIDNNYEGKTITNKPFEYLWKELNGISTHIKNDFLIDMLFLFRQMNGEMQRNMPSKEMVMEWMDRNPSGLDEELVEIRKKNKDRIIRKFIYKIDKGEIKDAKFNFEEGISLDQKYKKINKWWDTRLFQLRFAIRDPEVLNEMLDNSIPEKQMKILRDAKKVGIPTFVNPYYLSLMNVYVPDHLIGSDEAIREYVFYSKQLVKEFGDIKAWEKEDIIEPGKPNAAGWILPNETNIHRRYPEVSILIPDTQGRACGGLCSSCQRMYDFQSGHLNFNLKKLHPKETWPEKLKRLMVYFEKDSQLRDILITGGDALMSSDKSLQLILDAVYEMALNKIEANKKRKNGEKYAEIVRVRLGTRLPVYLPQRITHDLINILAAFKKKARKIGIKQFVIQTHFETSMEITVEAKQAIADILSAGWIITNQQVFTSGASKRGHTAKLRKVLNDVGVLPYYTFTVKGFLENSYNFATNERAMEEQFEEKVIGKIKPKYYSEIKDFALDAENMIAQINNLREKADVPFLATDRNVINLPGVGKSLSYRTIGLTASGRRILEFAHDHTRNHSPIIKKMKKVVIIESKSVSKYIRQLMRFGEDIEEYDGVYGYSLGETEPRMPIYEYPEYSFDITEDYTNLKVD